jgi:ubiquitin carboxyl-terminal hydrolase 34
VLWAEREHKMMQLFFNNLKYYMSNYVKSTSAKSIPDNLSSVHNPQGQSSSSGLMPPLFSHMSEVTVRLQFLTTIFSPMGSPTNFRYYYHFPHMYIYLYFALYFVSQINTGTSRHIMELFSK